MVRLGQDGCNEHYFLSVFSLFYYSLSSQESQDPIRDTVDGKYQKLAHEYSKVRQITRQSSPKIYFLFLPVHFQLRAQANVLKKALLEEQTKSGQLKETARLKEVQLRRSEQEVDSLTFRNNQLEHRVAALQADLERQQAKQQKRPSLLQSQKNSQNGNGNANNLNNNINNATSKSREENIVAEEFQKKIIENAQLISVLADKSRELEECQQKLQELERVNGQLFQQSFVEEGLRSQVQQMSTRIAELEMKLMVTSDDDKCSVTTDNSSMILLPEITAPVSSSVGTEEVRVLALQKELNVLRAKYELLQLQEQSHGNANVAGVCEAGGEGDEQQQDGEKSERQRTEEILFGHFSQKIDDMLLEKQLAESKLVSYMVDCDNLRDQLEVLTDELRDQEQQLSETQRQKKTVEDHLQTTRQKYGEQISVLTEQVLSLSDQLAAASNWIAVLLAVHLQTCQELKDIFKIHEWNFYCDV